MDGADDFAELPEGTDAVFSIGGIGRQGSMEEFDCFRNGEVNHDLSLERTFVRKIEILFSITVTHHLPNRLSYVPIASKNKNSILFLFFEVGIRFLLKIPN